MFKKIGMRMCDACGAPVAAGDYHTCPTPQHIKVKHILSCPFCGQMAEEPIKTQLRCSNKLCFMSQVLVHDTLWNTRAEKDIRESEIDQAIETWCKLISFPPTPEKCWKEAIRWYKYMRGL